jgi:hypothetical protein
MNLLATCLVPALQRGGAVCERYLLAHCRQGLAADEACNWVRQLLQLRSLGCFFPPEHGLRKAVLALARLCRPLSQEGAAQLSSRQLVHALQLLQILAPAPVAALRTQLRRDLDRLLALRGCSSDSQHTLLAAHVRQLSLLAPLAELSRGLLNTKGPAPVAGSAGSWQVLLEWQLTLARAESAEEARSPLSAKVLLESCWQQRLEVVAGLCRASDWNLDYYCRSGLASLLRQCRQLARFCAAAAVLSRLRMLQQMLLDARLAGTAPAPAWRQDYASALAELLQPPLAAMDLPSINTRPLPPQLAPAAPAVSEALVLELDYWQRRLAVALAGADCPSLCDCALVLPLLYKPGWLLAAAGETGAAQLFRSAWQLLAQYWRLAQALPGPVKAVLTTLATQAGAGWLQLAPARVEQWQDCLLQRWPAEEQQVAVALPAATGMQQLPLAAVPALLATSLRSLTAITPEWFTRSTVQPATLAAVAADLELLEQGAAALKVEALENLCALLRDCHAWAGAIPATLLGQAHAQLLVLLDQAAAWQDARPDPLLLQALQAALATARQLPAVVAETVSGMLPALEKELQDYLQRLALVLEKPTRLELTCAGPVPGPQQGRLLVAILKPLLRFLLLDAASDVAARRAQRKTRITHLTVKLLGAAEGLILEAGDDCPARLPDATALRRLQRALPAEAGKLSCESRGVAGRCFKLRLPWQPVGLGAVTSATGCQAQNPA